MAYAYFTFSRGLRGCYMPDEVSAVRFKTRRELHAFMRDEAERCEDGEGRRPQGLSRKAVAAYSAEAWRRRNDPRWTMNWALGYGENRAFGLFLSRSNRRDHAAAMKLEAQEGFH